MAALIGGKIKGLPAKIWKSFLFFMNKRLGRLYSVVSIAFLPLYVYGSALLINKPRDVVLLRNFIISFGNFRIAVA